VGQSISNMVNASLTTLVGSRETPPCYWALMNAPYITGRPALADATDLIERFGDHAGLEASVRAARSRDEGNVVRYCHWRQIERMIATLSSTEALGTIH